jgi:hypothetical protein
MEVGNVTLDQGLTIIGLFCVVIGLMALVVFGSVARILHDWERRGYDASTAFLQEDEEREDT